MSIFVAKFKDYRNIEPYMSISIGKESSEGSVVSYNGSVTFTQSNAYVTPIGVDITKGSGGAPILGVSASVSAGLVFGPTEGLLGWGAYGTAGGNHMGLQYSRSLSNNEYYVPNGFGNTHTIGVVLSTTKFWAGGGMGYTFIFNPLTRFK